MRRRRYILCFNPKEAQCSKLHRKQLVELLENELSKHKDHDASSRWAIELLASKRFKRYLSITKDKKIRIDRAKIKEAERYDGKWVIETNDDTISIEDAACAYKSLMVIERCFRSLKRSRIKMTPMYHWLSHRIEAHVKISVLSLFLPLLYFRRYTLNPVHFVIGSPKADPSRIVSLRIRNPSLTYKFLTNLIKIERIALNHVSKPIDEIQRNFFISSDMKLVFRCRTNRIHVLVTEG